MREVSINGNVVEVYPYEVLKVTGIISFISYFYYWWVKNVFFEYENVKNF